MRVFVSYFWLEVSHPGYMNTFDKFTSYRASKSLREALTENHKGGDYYVGGTAFHSLSKQTQRKH